jgi:hypothetical protein
MVIHTQDGVQYVNEAHIVSITSATNKAGVVLYTVVLSNGVSITTTDKRFGKYVKG